MIKKLPSKNWRRWLFGRSDRVQRPADKQENRCLHRQRVSQGLIPEKLVPQFQVQWNSLGPLGERRTFAGTALDRTGAQPE